MKSTSSHPHRHQQSSQGWIMNASKTSATYVKECDRHFSKRRSPNHQIRDHATYPLASLWQVQGGQQVSAGVLLDGTRTRRSREALRNQGDISTRRTDSPRRAGFFEAPHESTHSL